MEQIEIEARFTALELQRNEFANQVVILSGQLALAGARINELTSERDALKNLFATTLGGESTTGGDAS